MNPKTLAKALPLPLTIITIGLLASQITDNLWIQIILTALILIGGTIYLTHQIKELNKDNQKVTELQQQVNELQQKINKLKNGK